MRIFLTAIPILLLAGCWAIAEPSNPCNRKTDEAPLKPGTVVHIVARGIPQPMGVRDVVGEDGRVAVPYLGQVLAAQKGPVQLASEIRQLYIRSGVFSNVYIQVIVEGSGKKISRGVIKVPGRYPVYPVFPPKNAPDNMGDFWLPGEISDEHHVRRRSSNQQTSRAVADKLRSTD